jgi:hypothetical protein
MDLLTHTMHRFAADLTITLVLMGGERACTPKRLRGADEAALLLAHLEAHWPGVWDEQDVIDALARQLLSNFTPSLQLALEAAALGEPLGLPRIGLRAAPRGESGTPAASSFGDSP